MHFVIAGRINCPQFSFAVMVAQRLKENLPGFTYSKIPKKPEEWDRWLVKTCQEQQWYHIRSPLVWREISLREGKKDFIGDIDKFLDLCYDYYGIPREALSAERFNREEMDWFTNRTESEFFENIKMEAKKRREYRSRQVCITGASSQITEILIMELLQLQTQRREDGLEIRLFDEPLKKKRLTSTANDAKYCPGPSGLGNCRVVSTLKDALTNVDLVIVLDCFARRTEDSLVKWLKRNRNAMCALGKALNMYAPPHCRVIIGGPSNQPLCYNATVLASYATKLHVRNIVAVTQDLGREMLRPLSAKVNASLMDFFCPPVWGFVGLNKFVDVSRTLQTHLYVVPGKRMNSTIPQGTAEYQLRTSECLLSEDQNKDMKLKQEDSNLETGRHPFMAKTTAIVDLLKVWGLKQEDGNGEILSLGVYSDGTFNIPRGIYWSQPVILVKGFWTPFPDYPIPRSSNLNLYYLFVYSVAALYRTKVKPRIYVPPTPADASRRKKKFDFDKVLEGVGMPVIRTDAECANYLKFLAKKELGIDFDAVDDAIDEQTEPESSPTPMTEEVKMEQIYCECWRMELKELQKIVFDRSSTTEVEMNLSDSVSGSEWSVINPKEEISPLNVPSGGNSGESFSGESKGQSSSTTTGTSSAVCSCGELSGGAACQCLVPPPAERPEEDNGSTEHFYKEQNAEIFEEDLKDALFEDSYVGEKHVSFDAGAKTGDETGGRFKFHGRKDAIRDEKADAAMRRRILKYERGGESSVGGEDEEGEGDTSAGGDYSLPEKKSEDDESAKEAKFYISVKGASYDIIGDQDGLDEMRKNATEKESPTSFREMYADEIVPTLQVLPPDAGMLRETDSERDASVPGEGGFAYKYSSEPGEGVAEDVSMASLEQALDAVWDEGLFHEEEDDEEEQQGAEKEATPKKKKRRREGIPLCCLCRCIVPEGLLCCPCGATTVVEVFKKESVEVFIQSEDDFSFRIEYFQTSLVPEESPAPSDIIQEEKEPEVQERDLPPESFFPFTPKPDDRFKESVRAQEMTKEDSGTLGVPEKCKELLEMAQKLLMEEKSEEEGGEEVGEGEEPKAPDEEEEGDIKTDFSNLDLFIPEGIEDWRLTVQKKYQEWFFQGPPIRDECYYDVAIEEVSEDEFEIDKEMEIYFEN